MSTLWILTRLIVVTLVSVAEFSLHCWSLRSLFNLQPREVDLECSAGEQRERHRDRGIDLDSLAARSNWHPEVHSQGKDLELGHSCLVSPSPLSLLFWRGPPLSRETHCTNLQFSRADFLRRWRVLTTVSGPCEAHTPWSGCLISVHSPP